MLVTNLLNQNKVMNWILPPLSPHGGDSDAFLGKYHTPHYFTMVRWEEIQWQKRTFQCAGLQMRGIQNGVYHMGLLRIVNKVIHVNESILCYYCHISKAGYFTNQRGLFGPMILVIQGPEAAYCGYIFVSKVRKWYSISHGKRQPMSLFLLIPPLLKPSDITEFQFVNTTLHSSGLKLASWTAQGTPHFGVVHEWIKLKLWVTNMSKLLALKYSSRLKFTSYVDSLKF